MLLIVLIKVSQYLDNAIIENKTPVLKPSLNTSALSMKSGEDISDSKEINVMKRELHTSLINKNNVKSKPSSTIFGKKGSRNEKFTKFKSQEHISKDQILLSKYHTVCSPCQIMNKKLHAPETHLLSNNKRTLVLFVERRMSQKKLIMKSKITKKHKADSSIEKLKNKVLWYYQHTNL